MNRHHGGVVLILPVFIGVLIIGVVGYIIYTNSESGLSSKENTTPTKTQVTSTPTSKQHEDLEETKKQIVTTEASNSEQSFESGGKYSNGSRYRITIKPGWEIRHEWDDSGYYDYVYIQKKGITNYNISIEQADRSGFKCYYPGDTIDKSGGYAEFEDYVNIVSNNDNKFRRATGSNYKATIPNENSVDVYIICEFSEKENSFVNFTKYGNLKYEIPSQNASKELVEEMDLMTGSLVEL